MEERVGAAEAADQPEAEETAFDEWAVLELMGHRRLYGRVREVAIFGATMCRIDLPKEPPVTQFYGHGSIYCLTPTSEAIVRKHYADEAQLRLRYYGADGDEGVDMGS